MGLIVRVRSETFPELTFDTADTSPPGAVAGAVRRFVRPQIVVELNGEVLATWAPEGEPDERSVKGMVLLVLLALGLYFAVRAMLR